LDGNVRWPRRVLPPGEYALTGQTDGWTPDRHIMLTARRGESNKYGKETVYMN